MLKQSFINEFLSSRNTPKIFRYSIFNKLTVHDIHKTFWWFLWWFHADCVVHCGTEWGCRQCRLSALRLAELYLLCPDIDSLTRRTNVIWPPAAPVQLAAAIVYNIKSGFAVNASRECLENGTWSATTNYRDCLCNSTMVSQLGWLGRPKVLGLNT